MSWMQRIAPTWMQSTQNTTQQHRRTQNSYEDRPAELQQRFPHHADQQPDATSSIQPQTSQDDHLRQPQFQSSHRITTPFQRDPFRQYAAVTSTISQRSCPEAAHSAATGHYPDHSNSSQRFCPEAAHSATSGHQDRPATAIQPAAMGRPEKPLPKKRTLASLPVAASRSFADSAVTMLPTNIRRTVPAEVPALVHYDSSTRMVHLGHAFVRKSDDSRNPSSGTEHSAALPTSTAATTIPVAPSEEDRIRASPFYRGFTPRPPSFVPQLRLPELQLAPFDGDIRKYRAFRDQFLDLVEGHPDLEPRHKLMHLLPYLKGEPREFALGFPLTDESYFIVINELSNRYGNKQQLQKDYLSELWKLKAPADDVRDLRPYYSKAHVLVQFLKSGYSTDLLASLVMDRLAEPLRLKLIQSYGCRGAATAQTVLDGLHQYIQDLEVAKRSMFDLQPPSEDVATSPHHPPCAASDDDRPASTATSDGNDYEDPREPTSTAAPAVEDVRLTERRTCPLCGLLHLAANCFMYLTIQKRLRRVLKLKICLLCLREGHPASMCPRRTKRSCKTCGHGQHHRILCKDADDSGRRKLLRTSQMRAPSRSSRDPRSSNPKRHSRKMSVHRDVTSRVTTAPKMCQPGTQRRLGHRSGNPRNNRKQRTWNHGADSQGRAGTSRPTTSLTERVKQKTAKANGDGRLLPARTGHLQTEPHSTTNESAKLMEQREAEEDSSSESSGGSSDTSQTQPEEPRDSTMLHHLEGVFCASSTDESTLIEQPDDSGYAVSTSVTADTLAVLLECARATAVNQRTGVSRDVIVFFDSGSNRSFATTTLLHDLDLPRHGTRSLRISTFGSTLPTTVEGVSTSIVLQSQHRRLPPLAVIARDCIVPSVRTALVEQSDLPMLRRNDCRPSSTITTPDILIGQDLVSHFQRQYGPPLPSGFHVIHSIIGPMIGGSGKVANIGHAAVTTVRAASAADVFIRRPPEADTTLTMTPSLQRTTCRSHLPTHLVVECTDIEPQSASAHTVEADTKSRFHPAHQAFFRTVEKHKFSGSKASTPECEVRHTLLDCTAGERPTRKHPNPLDNTAPLPLLTSTSHVLLPSEPPSSGPNTITACCAHSTFPGDHVPDVVLVAVTADAVSDTQAHGSRLPEVPASISGQQLRNPTHTVGLRTEQPVHKAPGSIEFWNTHEEAPLPALLEGRHTLLTCLNPGIDQPCRRTVNHRRKSRGHPSVDSISTRPHLVTGRAPRADHADQGDPHHSSVNDATNLAAGQAVQATDFDEAPRGKRKVQCAYCGRPHFSGRCNIYHSIKQRLNRLRQLNHCLLCLKPGHWSNACPNRKDVTCPHCANPHAHHVSLCRAYVSRRTGRSSAEQGPPSHSAPAAHQGPAPAAAVQRNSAKKVRAAPPATHSVARGVNSTGLSITISTFSPVLNHFCHLDESSPTTHSKARDESHSVQNRSAAVPSPAQAPSRQPSRTGRKGDVAASSGRTRLEQQRLEPDDAERTRAATFTARDANPIKPNRRIRATHGENTEHSPRDAKNHHRSMELHQEPLAETSAEPTQHADVRCELCTLHHRAERCTSFSSIEKRRQRAQYLWLCFACLAQDHRTEGCPNVGAYTCPICRDDGHHQALCASTSRPVIDQADAFSTPVVVPAEVYQRPLTPHTAVPNEDHQQKPTKAEHRRKPRKRKNRKSQK